MEMQPNVFCQASQEPDCQALQEPVRPVRIPFVLALALAQAAIFLALLPTVLILLPLQIEQFDAVNKTTLLGLASGVGAVLAILVNPVAGALSDRTTSRFGRRRPWIFAGAILTPASLLIMMMANGITTLFFGVLCFEVSLNITLSALTAILPDRVPVQQRGLAGALVGMAAPIAGMGGSVLVGSVIQDVKLSYLVIAGMVFVILMPFALLVPDERLPREHLPPFDFGKFLKSFWISPRKYPDFARVWLARCLSSIGYYCVLGFLLYYLQDAIHYTKIFPHQSVSQGVALLMVVSTVVMFVSAFLGGFFSDRFKRRKPFVIAASTFMALGLFVFALFPSWTAAIIAEAILGLGFGAYGSVDQALATQVLPSERDRAKDMGMINIANILPQTLGSALAIPILSLTHSYSLLFALTGLITLAGSWVVVGIKSVR
jgi:MFS family permease